MARLPAMFDSGPDSGHIHAVPKPIISSRTRVVIFDCDGVLIDSWESALYFFNSIRSACGLGPLGQEEERLSFMRTIPETLDAIVPPKARALAETLWREFPMEDILQRVKRQPGITALLDRLQAAGRKLAVCTNGGSEQYTILDHLDLLDRFDLLVTAEDVVRGKPWPDGPLRILERFQAAPDQALFIGDSSVDQQTAQNAAIPFWAFGNPALPALHHVRRFDDVELAAPTTRPPF